jgi:UDP-glucose 4-epimerase
MDLADGHAKAVPYIMNHTGWIAINLGCGRGYSVLEVVKAFEKASDRSVPYELVDRREGDIAANWCARAERLLGWKASRTIDDMCRDAWNFESNKR